MSKVANGLCLRYETKWQSLWSLILKTHAAYSSGVKTEERERGWEGGREGEK